MTDRTDGVVENGSGLGDLGNLLAEAIAGNWCARWACTTCGSHQLRDGLERLVERYGSTEAVAITARDEPIFPATAAHVFALRWIASRHGDELTAYLGRSPAGELYAAMISAKRSADRDSADHAVRNSRDFVEAERARKKAERAARHRERLDAKGLRDREWRMRQAKMGEQGD